LAEACRVEHALVVSSGTASLHLAVLALGLGPGDEVLVPAYTFPATANVVAHVGAKPVLVDVDPRTMSLDPERTRAAVTPRTRAVIAVHLFGRPLDWEALPDEVELVEDAAGALGAWRRGRPCGGLGRLGCLSFHPRKIVTTGEGGAVTTTDDELAQRIREMRDHGIVDRRGAFEIATPGLNYRLSDILCAVGIPQLARLEELLQARERVAAAYADRLTGLVELPTADEAERGGAARGGARRGPDRVRGPRPPRRVDRGDREAGRHLAAVRLPPLRDEEGALQGDRRPLPARDAGDLPARRRGQARRGGASGHGMRLRERADRRPHEAQGAARGVRGVRRPRDLRGRAERIRRPRRLCRARVG